MVHTVIKSWHTGGETGGAGFGPLPSYSQRTTCGHTLLWAWRDFLGSDLVCFTPTLAHVLWEMEPLSALGSSASTPRPHRASSSRRHLLWDSEPRAWFRSDVFLFQCTRIVTWGESALVEPPPRGNGPSLKQGGLNLGLGERHTCFFLGSFLGLGE